MKKYLAFVTLTACAFAFAPNTADAQFRYYRTPGVYYTPPVYVPYNTYSYSPHYYYGYSHAPYTLYYRGPGFTYQYGQPRRYGSFGNNSLYSNYRWNRYRHW